MNEKSDLLKLFRKVREAVEQYVADTNLVNKSQLLSEKGKEAKIEENTQSFIEAMSKYREEMLKIVDFREKSYTEFQKREAAEWMKSADFQRTLTANLDMLEKGYLGKIETLALLDMYGKNDLAMDMIARTMVEKHSPYCDLLKNRITVRKQLNAFATVRNIIETTVNVNLIDKRIVAYLGTHEDKEKYLFSAGYAAIVGELTDDLLINSPDASICMKDNQSREKRFYGADINLMKAAHEVAKRMDVSERSKLNLDRQGEAGGGAE